MNYAKIKYYSIANGPGLRTSLFVQGCPIHCKGCFNQETWGFDGGQHFTNNTMQKLLSSMDEHTSGLSILGGEPLAPQNAGTVHYICQTMRKTFWSNKTIWLWTGYPWEFVNCFEIMKYLDVIIAGPFIEEQKDYSLPYCGSRNQQVIDVQASLKSNSIVLYKED